mgnify:CR=1 FL=1
MDRKFPVIVILQGGLNALLFYLPVLLVAEFWICWFTGKILQIRFL